MRIVLLQDEIYLPSYGGGIKANRCLLQQLAERGHECFVLSRALTRSPDGPNDVRQFLQAMSARRLHPEPREPDVWSYSHQRVHVDAFVFSDDRQRQDYVSRRVRDLDPDWVLVADDKRRFMLTSALEATPRRVILLLQTIIQLPFGPLSIDPSSSNTELLQATAAIVVISRFMQNYMLEYGGMQTHFLPMPVYGKGPFPDLSRFDDGFVTMINPCELKGVDIFLQLARNFPDVPFAAVPTWGTGQDVLKRLGECQNVQVIAPSDEIDDILAETRILLVPSLWPETFGYVVPEAMLRGIPVLASNVGGLPEAKLGVDYCLPVVPGKFQDDGFVSPAQDLKPWNQALHALLSDEARYRQCSEESRRVAHAFVGRVSAVPFERLMYDMNTQPEQKIHAEFQSHILRQPYSVVLDDFKLTVAKDVFPPDMGQCAQNLAKICKQYSAETAIDMGCGTGYLALSMKRSGIANVWASDIHMPAVQCTLENVRRNHDVGDIHVVQSDLFEAVPADVKFDLVVFNQPFGPARGKAVCGCGADGGYQISKRFLLQAAQRLRNGAVAIMAFSDREPSQNSPRSVAEELGMPVRTLLHAYYGDANNYIFEIRPNERV